MASIQGSAIRKLVVACDVGMGSSVLLASTLRRQLKKNNVDVSHSPVASIPADADVVLTQEGLFNRARSVAPDKVIIPFKVFIGDPTHTRVVNAIQNDEVLEG